MNSRLRVPATSTPKNLHLKSPSLWLHYTSRKSTSICDITPGGPRSLTISSCPQRTCREFHRAITREITTAVGQSTTLALQDIQFKLVSRYSGRLVGADYREMPLAQAMFGHFWKNPMICEDSGIFDDLFGGLDETGRLVLVCLSGGFLEKCKSRNEPGEDLKVQKLKRDESYCGLVFTRGSYHFVGDCMSFQTVNSCHFAVFEGHDSKECISFRDAAGGEIKRLGVPSKNTDVPKILASEPDSWWLAQFTDGKDDWKEWHLVNFKKKRIIVGPMGVATEWPDFLDLEEFNFWNFDYLKETYFEAFM